VSAAGRAPRRPSNRALLIRVVMCSAISVLRFTYWAEELGWMPATSVTIGGLAVASAVGQSQTMRFGQRDAARSSAVFQPVMPAVAAPEGKLRCTTLAHHTVVVGNVAATSRSSCSIRARHTSTELGVQVPR